MPRFRHPKAQAEYVIKQNLSIGSARHHHAKENKIHSLGTKRNYLQALTQLTTWLQTHRLGELKQLNTDLALQYLEQRSQVIGQKTLDQERQAIQMVLNKKLPVIKSEYAQILKSRAYTPEQVHLIAQAQTAKHHLATEIAFAAGLRAHELLTLRKKSEQIASCHRQWSSKRFSGRQGTIYTVKGKGGLIREVLIPKTLAEQLETYRLAKPLLINDRTIHYQQYYAIGGGKAWSNSFSAASKRLFHWSHGAHGLRHSYAQTRLQELQHQNFVYRDALAIISQELVHFRSEITEVYLR
jgi:integrase